MPGRDVLRLPPLTAWCTSVGDCLAAMLRTGSAGPFTVAHIAVLNAAIAQLPPDWRGDLLVPVDGAGVSRDLVHHPTTLNTPTSWKLTGPDC